MSLLEAWEFFRWSILAILVAGTVLPLIGSWLFVRRTSFHGLALPQFAPAARPSAFCCSPGSSARGCSAASRWRRSRRTRTTP